MAACAGGVFLALINAIFSKQCALDPSHLYPEDYTDIQESFDYVIIGGGTAGSVLANRLSENSTVLVIEAGGLPTTDSEVPGLFGALQNSEIDWQYVSEPNDHSCLGFDGGACLLPRGKVLGGTSTISAMVYNRGSPEDYKNWGWDYNEVLAYFKKSENVISPEYLVHNRHGTGGYFTTSYKRSPSKLRKILLLAAGETAPVYLDEEPIGFFEVLNTIFNGTRVSAAKAFLAPIKTRGNLKITLDSYASQILIEDGKATAVLFTKSGTTFKVKANNEIIVSAGAVNSPKLLMLSGIGPKHHLENLGIDVLQDLPVGQNLQDHFAGTVMIKINPTNEVEDSESLLNYCLKREGNLGTIDISNLVWFYSTRNETQPDIQIYFSRFTDKDSMLSYLESSRLNPTSTKFILSEMEGSEILNVSPVLLAAKSRGVIRLRSKNPREYPLIYTKYLEDPEDVATLINSLETIREYINTEPLQEQGAELLQVPIPGCDFAFGTWEYWECSFRSLGTTLSDLAGTCAMGSVVDEKFKVYNIEGLRIVDASIIPVLPRANTLAPTIMIAERASDIIKADWT